jgi:transcriptional regulator of arginine metabolism
MSIIRRLLQDHEVGSQEQLAELLLAEGVRCTQATLSRDLRDLGVSRVASPEGPRYQLDPRNRYLSALRKVVGMEIQRVRSNGVMIVVRTLTGRAEGVAGFLDAWGDDHILGTVAGDDTVLVVPTDINVCDELVARITALMEGDGEAH